jgi:predicted O-methyltransferase YrrM
MRISELLRRRSGGAEPNGGSLAPSIHELWDTVSRFAIEIQGSEFMAEMRRESDKQDGAGLMGALDCATLYGLTRWRRPSVVVESGGYHGMSSAFILKALADERLTEAKLFSLEWDKSCDHGKLIPKNLRDRFVPLRGRVEDFVKGDELPGKIEMFLHDSSHRYRHMLWEFRQFWKRLDDGGLLVSHDVHFNPAFAEFVAGTQVRDRKGVADLERATNYEWGRWGYIGFVIKKEC